MSYRLRQKEMFIRQSRRRNDLASRSGYSEQHRQPRCQSPVGAPNNSGVPCDSDSGLLGEHAGKSGGRVPENGGEI